MRSATPATASTPTGPTPTARARRPTTAAPSTGTARTGRLCTMCTRTRRRFSATRSLGLDDLDCRRHDERRATGPEIMVGNRLHELVQRGAADAGASDGCHRQRRHAQAKFARIDTDDTHGDSIVYLDDQGDAHLLAGGAQRDRARGVCVRRGAGQRKVPRAAAHRRRRDRHRPGRRCGGKGAPGHAAGRRRRRRRRRRSPDRIDTVNDLCIFSRTRPIKCFVVDAATLNNTRVIDSETAHEVIYPLGDEVLDDLVGVAPVGTRHSDHYMASIQHQARDAAFPGSGLHVVPEMSKQSRRWDDRPRRNRFNNAFLRCLPPRASAVVRKRPPGGGGVAADAARPAHLRRRAHRRRPRHSVRGVSQPLRDSIPTAIAPTQRRAETDWSWGTPRALTSTSRTTTVWRSAAACTRARPSPYTARRVASTTPPCATSPPQAA